MKELDIGSATSTIILISGYGTNLQAILDEITNNHLPIRILSVLSDNPEAYGIKPVSYTHLTLPTNREV